MDTLFFILLDPDDEGNTERDKKYVCIATIMIGVVMTLHELSQSAFPLGVSADTITKVPFFYFFL